jgi:hypothetical protein
LGQIAAGARPPVNGATVALPRLFGYLALS